MPIKKKSSSSSMHMPLSFAFNFQISAVITKQFKYFSCHFLQGEGRNSPLRYNTNGTTQGNSVPQFTWRPHFHGCARPIWRLRDCEWQKFHSCRVMQPTPEPSFCRCSVWAHLHNSTRKSVPEIMFCIPWPSCYDMKLSLRSISEICFAMLLLELALLPFRNPWLPERQVHKALTFSSGWQSRQLCFSESSQSTA